MLLVGTDAGAVLKALVVVNHIYLYINVTVSLVKLHSSS